ncbi:efflux RND transporter periplasmic adaptor subunit [Pseudomonas sp. EL_65y_Pfl2_R95]|uniref:efflux RND transporter periplasmic adaptor subunit n=1 Tax=Pseudomonas sp. EL_65y_Pfl2_R95 TaxID=3088698 RepID=UPI0030D8B822
MIIISVLIALSAAGGYAFAILQSTNSPMSAQMPSTATSSEKKALYWYDPMYPQQKFDQPGKSPFMDMQLVPRYGDAGGDATGISIDSGVSQNLGMRLATVTLGSLNPEIQAVGVLTLNDRDVAIVQARSPGFVERVYAQAPQDVIPAGTPLADILVPDWASSQEDYLALRNSGVSSLIKAAKQRMRLVGMPAALINKVERSGKLQPVWTVTSPISGVIEQLDVRQGMTLTTGMTLARINGLSSVWLDIAVPEAQAMDLAIDHAVEARLSGGGSKVIKGRISAILPQADLQSRTVRVRVELDNRDGKLRPGQTASVRLAQSATAPALLVPSEAVIRSGRRALVMLVTENNRYQATEVVLGQESGDQIQIIQGLESGQQIVASGQFLLDSEASLRGIEITALGDSARPLLQPALHPAEGKILNLDSNSITLAHGPFKTLSMPGMTMQFPVASPQLLEGLRVGERVRVSVSEGDHGLQIEQIEPVKMEAQP